MDYNKYYKPIVLLASLLLFFSHLEVLPVTIMEARNFITAREMITDGNWILTTMNGNPRYEKPPLPTWFSAISASIFGVKSIFAYRLPVALMGSFTVLTFFNFIKLISNNIRLAFIASLILASSFYVIAIQKEAPWDIYAHGFMLMSILYLYKIFVSEEKKLMSIVLAGFFLGLAILSKGPVSPYALLLPFLIAFGWVFGYQNFKKKLFSILLVISIGLVVGGWWYLYVRYTDPTAFIEISSREAGRWGSYNVRPFYYYWSFFTQSGIWTIPAFIGVLYPYLKNRVSNTIPYKFLVIWTIGVLVLLSVIPEKKSRYLLPILIPLAGTTAFYIEYLILSFRSKLNAKERLPVYFNFGLIGFIGILFPLIGYWYLNDNFNITPNFYFVLCSLLLFSSGVGILFFLFKKNMYRVFLITVGFMIILLATGIPIFKSLQTNSNYLNISNLHTNEFPIYYKGELSPEMIWYYGQSIPEMTSAEEKDTFLLLVSPQLSKEIEKTIPANYHFQLLNTYDINYSAKPGDKKHKHRLTNMLYLIEKSL